MMLTKETFIQLIKNHKKQRENLDVLMNAGLDLWEADVIEYGNKLFDTIIDLCFDEDGTDWIYWWLYDKDNNPDIKAFDNEHNEIPTETIEDLWQVVKDYLK
jgi:hypothetical protein